MKYKRSPRAVSKEFDDLVKSMQNELKKQTGLTNISYTDVTRRFAILHKQYEEEIKRMKKRKGGFYFDSKI